MQVVAGRECGDGQALNTKPGSPICPAIRSLSIPSLPGIIAFTGPPPGALSAPTQSLGLQRDSSFPVLPPPSMRWKQENPRLQDP